MSKIDLQAIIAELEERAANPPRDYDEAIRALARIMADALRCIEKGAGADSSTSVER